jgi:predicted ATPase/DNA-binding CsgD family transcriptional regulator
LRASSSDLQFMTLAATPQRLFGRDSDLRQLLHLVQEHRLVTLVGPGGVGKTALAMAACDALRKREPLMARVDLAPVIDPALVLPHIGVALDVNGDQPIVAALVERLGTQRVMVFIDNCEHLLTPVAEAALSLLAALPGLHILATSQAALNVRDERVLRLAPLAVPAIDEPFATASEKSAIKLFVERATSRHQGFALSPANLPAIREICGALDGLPLAIELAAARVHTLGIEGVRTRLGERLRLLNQAPREQTERHKSLRTALVWSHDLLAPELRVVFRRLAIFSGTFSLEAAQRICSAPNLLDEWAVLEAVSALVEKSLLSFEESNGFPRYRLLETLRFYALEQCDLADERRELEGRHLAYFLEVAETAAPHLEGAHQGEWLRQIHPDRENFLAAHRACDRHPSGAEHGLRLANALSRYWLHRSSVLLGDQVFAEACVRPGVEQFPRLLAEALYLSGWHQSLRKLHRPTIAKCERAYQIAKQEGLFSLMSMALARIGYAHLSLSETGLARTALEEARDLADQEGSSSVKRIANSMLAELERFEGHYAIAEELYQRSYALAVELGDLTAQMIANNNLAWTAIASGDLTQVRVRAETSLTLANQLESRRGRLIVMEFCAAMAVDCGEWVQAAQLDGAAEFHTAQMGRHRDIADQALLFSRLEFARLTLGNEAFKRAQAAGRALPYEAAVGILAEWLMNHPASLFNQIARDRAAQSAPNATQVPIPIAEDADAKAALTPREREVISLVARGYNNADIARLLDISVLTVRTHRQRLMQKLNVRNAAEITAFAVRAGIFIPG